MSSITLKKAQRKRVKLKLGISSPSGGGKTASSLILAYGLIKGENPKISDEEAWSKVAIIDTENGSGELYANMKVGTTQIGEYNAITIDPPFDPQKYIEAIDVCQEAGIEVCIIDSLTHCWSGQGGLLEKQGNISKRSGNSYTAWREITPLFNSLIDKILQCDMHMILAMRSKTEYAQEKDEKTGKTTIRKLGTAPVFRDGIEYEVTSFFEIDTEHQAFVSKDRTGVLDGQYFVITPDTGKKLAKWLEGGVAADAKDEVVLRRTSKVDSETELNAILEKIDTMAREYLDSGIEKKIVLDAIEQAAGIKNYHAIKDVDVARKTLEALNTLKK